MNFDHLKIVEHKSSSYGPRTYHNAAVADLTIAFAVDFTTAGERLTKKAAGEKLVEISFAENTSVINDARKIWRRVDEIDVQAVNVAGNGIYTFHKHGFRQEWLNSYIYEVLKLVCAHSGINKIVSGGQTGADLAGGVAGAALGIETIMMLPKGFKQRHENGVDVCHTEEEIRQQVVVGVEGLL